MAGNSNREHLDRPPGDPPIDTNVPESAAERGGPLEDPGLPDVADAVEDADGAEDDPPRRRVPWAGLLAVVAVASLAVAAYWNAAPPVTVHDDVFFVPARRSVTWENVAQMFREDTWATTGSPAGTYRPLTILSIAVNGEMFGRDPVGYHATNIALHALASVFVFLLAFELLGAGGAWAAALAAAVFAVHPIHTEAVDSIFNRSEILATTGVVAALWILARWAGPRPVAAWGAAAVLYLLALLCRESAVTLPALAAAMLWLRDPSMPWRSRLAVVAPALFLLLPLGEYYVLRDYAMSTATQAEAPALGIDAADDFLSRLAYSAASLREYARMLVWPHPLRMSYENFAGDGLASALAVNAALAAAAFAMLRRAPVATFAVVFFYVALVPSTRVFTSLALAAVAGDGPLLELKNSLLLGERIVYLPSVALSLGLAAAFDALVRRRAAVLAGVLALPLVAAALVLTLERNRQWHDAVALFAADVAADPDNTDGWRLYVSALSGAGRLDEARAACDGQMDREGRSAQLFNNCGVVYDRLGQPDQAIRAYTLAIEQGLETVGHANRGRVYAALGRLEEAEAEYAAAAEAENDPARRHYRNGLLLQRFHPERRAEARREFEAALALQPDFGAARQALSRLPR